MEGCSPKRTTTGLRRCCPTPGTSRRVGTDYGTWVCGVLTGMLGSGGVSAVIDIIATDRTVRITKHIINVINMSRNW